MRISVRNLRIIAAVALTGAVIWATAPYATSYVSSQAVVNAPLNTVLSPMQGYIAQRSPAAGTGVAAGAPLVVTEVEERDHRYLEDLRARLVLLGENLASADRPRSKHPSSRRWRRCCRRASGIIAPGRWNASTPGGARRRQR
jgi:hypothetical protein